MYYAAREYQKAVLDYDRGIALAPNNAELYFNRGISQVQLQNHKQALADYNTAIRLQPNHALAYSNRGLLHAQLQANPAATADLRMAAKLFQAQNNPAGYESVLRKLEKLK
jgi:tetratricopeptide (TPR) repeat protein